MREGNAWQAAARLRQPITIALLLSVAGHTMALLTLSKAEVATEPAGGSARTMHVVLRAPTTLDEGSRGVIRNSSRDGGNPQGTETSAPRLPVLVLPDSPSIATEVEYIPSAQLAHGPAVLGTVDIRRPEADLENAEVVLYSTLYINEEGLVDRVEVDELERHSSFAEAAIGAFRGARFHPGQRLGRAVKSLMRIEVLFEPVEHAALRK